ncbi:sensor histidine kinase [Fodinicola acaciae]|uniref:sensor histidine kinase n=1 Tax=Fodinicola acaciae TaxID=2681555 RepID=UPI0013D79A11|nr:HAMP domain-containing sensor histidine kinase [Fodinicola acaciae]
MNRGDQRVLRRARWVLTAQLAGAVTIVVLLMGALSFGMMLAGQHSDAERDLRAYVVRGDIEHPPPCVWLFSEQGVVARRTPSAPVALPVRSAMDEVARTGVLQVRETTVGGIDYLIRTERRGTTVVQAVLDLRYQVQERQRLTTALGIAELVGLFGAALAGLVLARRAMAPLEEALDRQSRFVADASHELRTPLTRLRVRAQLLARKLSSDAEARKLVADTDDMASVIDDLLLSTQVGGSAGGFPVDLELVASSVLSAEAERAQCSGVSLELVADPSARYVVRGIQPALLRVVSALVDNALGHTTAGGRIVVALERTDRHVRLSVRDTGIGLDPRDASRIFRRFARGPHRARNFGLGLALVREVVQGHGGSVTATGEPGHGAVFTVSLPAPSRTDGPAPLPSPRRGLRAVRP